MLFFAGLFLELYTFIVVSAIIAVKDKQDVMIQGCQWFWAFGILFVCNKRYDCRMEEDMLLSHKSNRVTGCVDLILKGMGVML